QAAADRSRIRHPGGAGGGRADGAGDHEPAGTRRRGGAPRARAGGFAAEDQGYRDPAGDRGADDARRGSPRGVPAPRRGRRHVPKSSQDVHQRRLERDPEEHHRPDDPRAVGAFMRFSPTPEQQQLGDMVQRFFAEQYRFDARRKILDSREGWSRETWSKLAELGLLSLQVPEEQGGMAPAVVETLLTATATGTAMLLEAWGSSAVIGTVLIRGLGSAQQRDEMLTSMAAGERIAVPAHSQPRARDELRAP